MNKQNQSAKASLPKPIKRRVPLKEITTDEELFQPRFAGLVERHVAALQDVLCRGSDLDPISLWEDPETGELTVTDGHHRLEAYKRERPRSKVSAHIYRCDRNTALQLPMIENAKTRLMLSYAEKANKAWRLTVEGVDLSAKGVANLCGISKRTVNHMRKTKKQLMQAEATNHTLPWSWLKATEVAKGKETQEAWDDAEREWREEEAVNKADEAFGAALSELFRRWPSAGARLVERCAGNQGKRVMLEDWGAVAVTDDAEDIGLLAMRLGETLDEEQLDALVKKARAWPYSTF